MLKLYQTANEDGNEGKESIKKGSKEKGRGFHSFICDQIYDSSANIFFSIPFSWKQQYPF